jgi:hypothetical protein
VIKATGIKSVVSMVPHTLDGEEYWYMFEKVGMDLANLGGFFEAGDEDIESNGRAAGEQLGNNNL